MKTCITCNIEKPIAEFYYRLDNKKFRNQCISCKKLLETNRRKNDPFKYKTNWVSKMYNITIEEYYTMLIYQNEVCAICNQPETKKDPKTKKLFDLAIDHCHKTGKIRGLLCSSCNLGIGKLKENINILKSAIKYLMES